MTSITHLIFVYGTLKKGFWNHPRYLQRDDATFVGEATTVEKFPLYVSGLPYLINDPGVGHNVKGQIFEISDSCLQDLDRLEGHPTWYRRTPIKVEVDGKILDAEVYFNLDGDRFKGRQTYPEYLHEHR